jgi:C4-dicarboxylate transporter DctM subunit
MIRNLGRLLEKTIDGAVEASGFLAGCILLVMALITGYEVIVRYVFNSPTHWTLDLSIYLLIWFSYASLSSLQKANRHVRVDLIVSRLSVRTQALWDIMTKVIFLFFTFLMFYYVAQFAWEAFVTNEYGWAMWRVLTWPIKAAMPFGTVLLGLCLVKDIVAGIQSLPASSPEERRGSFFHRPAVVLSVFSVAIGVSVFFYTVSPVLGMVLLMLVLLFGGVPIFPALGLVGVVGYYLVFGGESAVQASFPSVGYSSLENFALVCLPLFVFVGQAISSSGVSEEIYDSATKWVGHLPGGEAIGTILACSIFAAVSVSSVATATTIGLIALPALAIRKYNKKFSYGLLAAGGTLGIMIPPSGTMIIYSAVTEESLGKLFLAGVIPGILLAAAFIVYAVYFCSKTGEYEKQKPASWSERFSSTKRAAWGLLAPLIILGGIYSGVFTPLESGAVAVIYVLFMVLLRGKIRPRDLIKVVTLSTHSSVMVLSIIIGALLLGDFMTLTKAPDKALDFVNSLNISPWGVMAALMFLYIILGMFLEVVSIMLITLPIVYPLIIKLGFDGIWFAVMITLNMEMAIITPPVGLNLYVITGLTRASLSDVLKGAMPFFFIMLSGLLFFALFPSLSTWLPNAMIRR